MRNMRFGLIALLLLFVLQACQEDNPVRESCFDGIKNQNEIETDCGGVCITKCRPVMKAKVNSGFWEADTAIAAYSNGNGFFTLRGSRKSGIYPLIQLFYTGPLAAGTYPLDPSSAYIPNLSSFTELTSGSITLNTVDPIQRLIAGSFSFSCTDNLTGTTYVVTEGTFKLIPY